MAEAGEQRLTVREPEGWWPWRWWRWLFGLLVVGLLLSRLVLWMFALMLVEDERDEGPPSRRAELALPVSELSDGGYLVVMAVNEAGLTLPGNSGIPRLELTVSVSAPSDETSFGMRLENLDTNRLLDADADPWAAEGDTTRHGVTTPVEQCRRHAGACLARYRLVLEQVDVLAPGTALDVTSLVEYPPDGPEDGDRADVVVGVFGDDVVATSSNQAAGLLPGTVLLTPKQPTVDRDLVIEIPRREVPRDAIHRDGTADITWVGGMLRPVLATRDTHVVVAVETSTGRHRLEILDPDYRRGRNHIPFELPFVATCNGRSCAATITASFTLNDGPWAIIDWSNEISGMRTTESRMSVRNWTLLDNQNSTSP